MRYSIEPRDRIYVKAYGFLSFTKNIGTHATKVAKNISNKCSQKLLDSAKKSTTDAIKTVSRMAMQKTEKAPGDLLRNKIADKITGISKSPQNDSKELHSKTDENEIEVPKGRYISPEKRQQIIDELRLV